MVAGTVKDHPLHFSRIILYILEALLEPFLRRFQMPWRMESMQIQKK